MRTDQRPAERPDAGPDHDDRRQTKPTGPSSSARGGLTALLLAVLLLGGIVAASVLLSPPSTRPTPPVALPYQPAFLDQVRAGNVVSVHTEGASVEGELQRAVRWPADDEDARQSTRFTTEVPAFADLEALGTLLAEHDVTVEAEAPSDGRPFFQALILAAVPFLLIGGVVLLFLRRTGAGRAGGLIGRSPARIVEPGSRLVTFADVAGVDEAKEQLTEIVDFLRDPAKYRALGGRMPHGVLLTGPPGTGKTLLARALAGEAGVPFFSMSASEFVEMYVGVGASRVRDLFAKAKAAAPAIVFIDELDAIGRARGPASGLGGAHEEREQTLNQILTELDGFDPSSGVIVLSATNRAEIIDRALLRPGRFDRRVAVQPPDITGRRQILAVHTRSMPLAADADLDTLARSTPGMVGADLANLVNEAALLAARRGHAAVGNDDLLDALEQIVLGTERRIVLSEADRRRTAYHEAAHALTGMLLPAADPVRKVSIIPHGEALGVTLASPEADRFNIDEDELRARLQVLLAGRAGERLALGSVTTGAENDITMATELARHMAGRWGMSEAVGPVDLLSAPGAVAPWHHELAPETERVLDSEVRRLVEEAQEDALALLAAHRPQLDALAAALLERETLDAAQAAAAAGLPARAAAALTGT